MTKRKSIRLPTARNYGIQRKLFKIDDFLPSANELLKKNEQDIDKAKLDAMHACEKFIHHARAVLLAHAKPFYLKIVKAHPLEDEDFENEEMFPKVQKYRGDVEELHNAFEKDTVALKGMLIDFAKLNNLVYPQPLPTSLLSLLEVMSIYPALVDDLPEPDLNAVKPGCYTPHFPYRQNQFVDFTNIGSCYVNPKFIELMKGENFNLPKSESDQLQSQLCTALNTVQSAGGTDDDKKNMFWDMKINRILGEGQFGMALAVTINGKPFAMKIQSTRVAGMTDSIREARFWASFDKFYNSKYCPRLYLAGPCTLANDSSIYKRIENPMEVLDVFLRLQTSEEMTGFMMGNLGTPGREQYKQTFMSNMATNRSKILSSTPVFIYLSELCLGDYEHLVADVVEATQRKIRANITMDDDEIRNLRVLGVNLGKFAQEAVIGINALHALGFVHGDMKCDNLLVRKVHAHESDEDVKNWEIVLTDFGYTHIAEDQSEYVEDLHSIKEKMQLSI